MHRSPTRDLVTRDMSPLSERSTLLFDLDGTLVDSSADLTETLRRLLEEEGLPVAGRAEVISWVGDGAETLVKRALASRGRSMDGGVMARFRAHHDACCLLETRPYPGIPALLESLSPHRRLAIVTNKPTDFAERVVEGTGLAAWVQVVVGPERVPERKPSPLHVLTALDLLGSSPAEAVMIGDGVTDLRAGAGAGCATVGVLWGFRGREELEAERPDALVDDVPALARILGV